MYFSFRNVSLDRHVKHFKEYDYEMSKYVDLPKNEQKTKITNIKKHDFMHLQDFIRFVLDCDRDICWHYDDESRTMKAVITCEISAEI
tara:strand:- start:2148 stop:2411 length:264 start_codon:yes stop_codon:yes gene_type:complete